MPLVFLCYSTKDHFFAELASAKLAQEGITLWRDQGQLRAGMDWRQSIEQGISECDAVLVALSPHSAESSYVTFEWAYALGRRKPILPLKLGECKVHPRLETIQHLDFSVPAALPWAALLERIREIEPSAPAAPAPAAPVKPPGDPRVTAILDYLNGRGYQMASFERLRTQIDGNPSDAEFKDLIARNSTIFRLATLRGGRPGVAKLIP